METRIILSIITLLALLPTSGVAEDLSLESSASAARVEYVALPPLIGALSLDAAFVSSFAISNVLEPLEELGGDFSIGWRHFLNPHGELSVRTYGVGGLRFGGMMSLGVGAEFMIRGFSPQFAFGGVGLLAEARWMSWDGSDRTRNGLQILAGIEVTFGKLIGGSWLAFGETGTSVSIAHTSIDGYEGWEVIARWLIRFDFAFRSGLLSSPIQP